MVTLLGDKNVFSSTLNSFHISFIESSILLICSQRMDVSSPQSNIEDEITIVKSPTAQKGLTDDQVAGLTRLTMRLYCLPYSEEFRQPVQVKYPDLLEAYMSVIRTPCDLGTILLKLKNKTYKTADDCAKELKLCFQNAIQFNADLSNLVSISNHLLTFTENLWHSIMQTPFTKPVKKTTATADAQLFRQQASKSRQMHYQETKNMPMRQDEVQYFLDQLNHMPFSSGHCPFQDAVQSMMTTCWSALSTAGPEDDTTEPVAFPSLAEFLAPLLDIVTTKFPQDAQKPPQEVVSDLSDEGVVTDSHLFSCFLGSLSANEGSWSPALALETNKFLRDLDHVLGEVTAILCERLTRG